VRLQALTARRATRLALPIRLLPYLALVAALWLKFRASHTTQVRSVVTLFLIAVLIANYYCLRLLRQRFQHPYKAESGRLARSTKVYVLMIGYIVFASGDLAVLVSLLRLMQGVSVDDNLVGASWLGTLLGVLFIWVGSYELRISVHEIEYFALAIGYHSIRLGEIERARVVAGWETYFDRFRPTSRLEIIPSPGAGVPIYVNLRVFRNDDMEYVFDWLGAKLRKS